MATLVLTAVGTLVGGPIGGAVGALLGGTLDRQLLGATARGPRLSDLSVQTSSYGNAIPKLFGTLRVAGTVIWATDLKEARHSSGGKGKPKTVSYTYSASFAVALSGRTLTAVHRIWADGNLLRGSAGDFKTQVGAFRFHPGDEDQPVDPLIASAEGIGAAPAHRGIAYVVFEDLQLADYGNRIPSLSFEVQADPAAVGIGAIAAALAPNAVAGGDATVLGGYAVAEDSVREAFDTLTNVMPLSLVDDGETLRLVRPSGAGGAIDADSLGAHAGDKAVARRMIERQASGTLPDEVSLAYFDPSRDYQSGTQRARRGGVARRRTELALAAALDAASAKALAETRLGYAWANRASATATLPWRWLDIRPGDVVTLPEDGARWRVVATGLEAMTVKLELAALPGAASLPAPPATGGRATQEQDAPAGTTIVQLLDLPALEDALPSVPRIWIAACGTEPGWRGAALSVSSDGGGRWDDIGGAAAPAIIGTTLGVLGDGDAALRDRVNSIDVRLAHDGMALAGRDDLTMDGGANLALIGDELIQFASAAAIGPAEWRLSGLLRGRRGTEWAIAGHAAGDRFVLLTPDSLLAYDPPVSALGGTFSVMALGLGDGETPVIASMTIVGRALRPPAPVRITARRDSGGDVAIGWRRRSRAGWAWVDGSDAPLGEESELYRLTLTPSIGAVRVAQPVEPAFVYTAAMQAADGSGGAATLGLTLAQLGSFAASLPAAAASFTP